MQKGIPIDALFCRCSRLSKQSLAFLWQKDQAELLQDMIDNDLNAIIIKVAALGFQIFIFVLMLFFL